MSIKKIYRSVLLKKLQEQKLVNSMLYVTWQVRRFVAACSGKTDIRFCSLSKQELTFKYILQIKDKLRYHIATFFCVERTLDSFSRETAINHSKWILQIKCK